MSCHGNRSFYSRRCVSCRTVSLPSFNGLRCKLTKIALFIQPFRERLSYKRGNANATMPKDIMGNDGFTVAWWKLKVF